MDIKRIKSTIFLQQKGSSLLEFIIGGIMVMLVIMGLIQMLLVYKSSVQLQQATFEAVRAGIVENGNATAIKNAFELYSIDFHGGGTNAQEIALSLATAKLATSLPLELGGAGYKLRVLNPTQEAFNDWAVAGKNRDDPRAIPNAWQHIQDPNNIGSNSGVSIQDANILKIEITYGLPLYMPVIGNVIGSAMAILDPANRRYYTASPARLPLTFIGLMHMQSDFYENSQSVSLDDF